MIKPLLAVLSTALAACGGGGGDSNAPAPGPSNRAPIAAISVDRSSGAAPLTVVMSGAGSSDPDGAISSYRFASNGATLGATASVQHTFTQPGVYEVTLTVTDNAGATGSATATVTVNAVLTGAFIDGSVQGLAYRTATQSGLTDASGRFRYVAGETVTFSIGGVELGSAPGAPRVTPFDFFGMAPPSIEGAVRAELYDSKVSDFDRVANITRLLVSLDTDRDLSNGVDLTGWNETLAGAHLSFDSDLYRFADVGEEFEEPGDLEKFARIHRVNRNVSSAQPLVYLYRALGVTVPARARDSVVTDSDVDGNVDSRRTLRYDADGYLLSVSYADYDAAGAVRATTSAAFTYDTAGHRLTLVDVADDDADDTVDYRSRQVSIYSGDGQLLSSAHEFDEDADDTADARRDESYTYDAAGRRLTYVVEYDQDADEATANTRDTILYTYGFDGRLLTRVSEYEAGDGNDRIDFRSSWTAAWDDDGRLLTLVKEVDGDADGRLEVRTSESYTYDDSGHLLTLTQEYDAGADGAPDSRTYDRYTYDDDGRPLTFASETDADLDGAPDSRTSESHAYDGHGRLLSRVSEYDTDADPGTPNPRISLRYTYDADGYPRTELEETDTDGDGDLEFSSASQISYVEIGDGLSHLIVNRSELDRE